MFLDDIKQNINKIDSDLKKFFENVYITEKVDKTSYFVEINANKMFLFEGFKKRVEVKAYINKDDLKFDTIKWSYLLNPLSESFGKIERVSYINSIAKDIYDIASNKRMVKEYFDALESHVDLILEECTPPTAAWKAPTETERREIFCGFIEEMVKKYTEKISGEDRKLENTTKMVNHYLTGSPMETIVPTGTIEYTAEISMANKFRLEKELTESGLVRFVSFNEDKVKVTI
jgi:hypothetical protein